MENKTPAQRRSQAKPAEKPEDVWGYLTWYLNKFGDTSEKNLRDKLTNKTDNQEWIDRAIEKAIDLGFQSDTRFAEMIARRGFESKHWGRSRIEQEMMKKGVPSDIAKEAIGAWSDEHPEDRAAEALTKKFRDREIAEQKDQAKATRYLASRGFDFGCISAAIKLHNDSLEGD